MGFLNKYKTDKVAEVSGTWVEVDETPAGKVEWLIARLNNEKARSERRKLEKPYRHFPNGTPEPVAEEILREIISKYVLLDWRGMTDEDDKPLEYSPETAKRLLKEYPDMLNDVVTLSAARETFQTEAVEAVKNA